MGTFSIWHWLVVLLVVILIFGTKKLRNIGSDLGGAVKNFKEGVRDDQTGQGRPEERVIEGEVTAKNPAQDKSNTHV